MNFKKLKWERVGDSFDLLATNITKEHIKRFEKLLQDVERPTPDFQKDFNKKASKKFREWFEYPFKPLTESAYTILSNWFLTASKAASKSSRAEAARILWDALFCVRPGDRLSGWRISGRRVIPERFEKWWKEQRRCQND